MTATIPLASGELLRAVESEDVTAGGAGFVVIAALAVGTVFLLRSLNKQLKKVDFEEEPFDEEPQDKRSLDEEPPDHGGEAESATDDGPEEGPRSPQP